MKRGLRAAVVAGAVLTMVFGAAGGAAAKQNANQSYTAGRYIVTFADEPVASYDGYKAGFRATRPQAGQKINPNSAAVQRWQAHLTGIHNAALARVGATKFYDYTITNNGVATRLSASQANKLAAMPGVVSLEKDQMAQPSTTNTPEFLGLTTPGSGLWAQLGGAANAGAGIVVGVLDTGIWPESASFKGGTGVPVPATWHGTCVAGELFPVTSCNDKLIGARYFVSGFNKHNIAKADYLSPRDGDGHGTHTASTAAGNRVTGVTIDGVQFEDGIASGMAPAAKVAAYKVCWEGKPGINPGCFNSDSVAAIQAAVADGVDVINYSIGGSSEASVLDSVEQAFRGASNANVFVAVSAGNSGPGASTFDHPSPWLTTTAASTVRRAFQAVELGNGQRFVGASTTPSLPTATSFVTSLSAKLASATDANAKLCAPGTLDPAKAAGKVVQCDRGVVDRIVKSFEVERAGGVGMVMTNTNVNSINGDYHAVPSVHVAVDARQPILDYITSAGAGATAKIVPLTAAELAAAPQVPEIAAFSSRGPSVTTEGDFLKPDIAAPGVDILASVAPPFHFGRNFDLISGTSMASPHMAGIAALLMQAHPNWLPSEIKSALMTSASDTVSSAGDPFAQGSGFVNPNAARDPGLVYPTTPNEYRSYLVSLGVQFSPPFNTLPPIAASDLNQASISVGKMAGTETITRRVKNVGNASATYTATINVPGITAEVLQDAGGGNWVEDNTLTLAPGAEGRFRVKFTQDDAPLGDWAIGALHWTDGSHVVRSAVAVQPVAVSAPDEVHVEDFAASGSEDFDITLGSLAPLDLSVSGLDGVTPTADSVVTGDFDINNPVADADTKHYAVVVPAGTLAARFDLDSLDDTADLDLYVYLDGDFVDLSASGAADEQVTLLDPNPGTPGVDDDVTYDVFVNGFATPGGSTSYEQSNFVLQGADDGNLILSPDPVPAPATLGDPSTVTASWTGLDTSKHYFGVIHYAGSPEVTFVALD